MRTEAFVDASALTAMLAGEDGAGDLSRRMAAYPVRTTTALAVWETTVAMARIRRIGIAEATALVDGFLEEACVEVVPVTPQAAPAALEAFDRFGKGRHPARLNLADCFAYACARLAGAPLLYQGDDFILTDIEAA